MKDKVPGVTSVTQFYGNWSPGPVRRGNLCQGACRGGCRERRHFWEYGHVMCTCPNFRISKMLIVGACTGMGASSVFYGIIVYLCIALALHWKLSFSPPLERKRKIVFLSLCLPSLHLKPINFNFIEHSCLETLGKFSFYVGIHIDSSLIFHWANCFCKWILASLHSLVRVAY